MQALLQFRGDTPTAMPSTIPPSAIKANWPTIFQPEKAPVSAVATANR